MLDISIIENAIKEKINTFEVRVKNDGSHYEIIVVSDDFSDLTPVKKQQLVYGPLTEFISTNDIQAVTIKTFTLKEWELQKKLI